MIWFMHEMLCSLEYLKFSTINSNQVLCAWGLFSVLLLFGIHWSSKTFKYIRDGQRGNLTEIKASTILLQHSFVFTGITLFNRLLIVLVSHYIYYLFSLRKVFLLSSYRSIQKAFIFDEQMCPNFWVVPHIRWMEYCKNVHITSRQLSNWDCS